MTVITKAKRDVKEYIRHIQADKRIIVLPIIIAGYNEIIYYLGRNLSKNSHHYDLSIALDHEIPLIPWTISIYWLCIPIWGIIYLYICSRDKDTAYKFFAAEIIGKSICFIFFITLPTTIIRPKIIGTGIEDTLIRFLYKIDPADNLFPSIHCMVSWYCFIGIRKIKECPFWWKPATLLFAITVCISTLTTRQHVIVDVFGGIVFAEISYAGTQLLSQGAPNDTKSTL